MTQSMSLQRFYLFAVATLCALAAALLANPAHARKVALVIANAEYQATSPLSNPPSDAALVAEAAKQAGFDDVTLVTDVGMEAFEAALREFRKKADGAEVAMVYYAGHGMEGKGKNWLLPVDAKLEAERDLPYEAIELDLVMDAMYGAQVRMVVLDACRNNPYANKWSSSTRAVARGLVPVEQDDVIVIYAAAPGMVAFDGDGNSPFAKSLAKRLPQPDLPLQLLGGTVRDDVLAETEGDQRPFVSASVTGT
ncbi:MAG: caspase family protein, partial [Sphingomonadaceae bacterium]|nr:caspase family protein [Sphingomonadaceae bacterium]